MRDRPPLNSLIRFSDGYEALVTEHTERGFKCVGAPGRFSHPRLGYHSTGEEHVFTDIPEARDYEVVKQLTAWQQSGDVMREVDLLEELIQLRLERPGETRESALQWAMDMRRVYAPLSPTT
jgi:hypothetical protein